MSVETLVVIIISLVVLAGGITLMYKWIYGAESIKSSLDEQTNSELERLLVEQGKQVALPRNVADLNRGENHVFGIGILNVGDESNFRIEVGDPQAVDQTNNPISVAVDKSSWLLYNDQPITLKQGQHVKEFINVKVPKENTPLGQYIFPVKVRYGSGPDEKQYGNTQKVIVNVKG